MHFHFEPDEITKASLDLITEKVIEHCAKEHCTCDPCVHLKEMPVLVVDAAGFHGLGRVNVCHDDTCYSKGRNN